MTSIGPTVLMIIMIVNMFLKVRAQKKTVALQPQSVNTDQSTGSWLLTTSFHLIQSMI
jgi:hypothetical protein